MNNLLNLKGVVALGKEQLKAINGGSQKRCSTSCVGKPIGIVGACYHNGSCNCPGVCVQGGGGQPQCQSA